VEAELHQFLQVHREGGVTRDFGLFERELHKRMLKLEREVLAEELERADVNAPSVTQDGVRYNRVLRSEDTIFTTAGEVRVMRTLYKDHSNKSSGTLCPLELRIGMLEGRWTPEAARQAAWVVSQLTPKVGEELFRRIGNMTPSKSALDRLPKQLSVRWEEKRADFEKTVREAELVPDGAVTVAISLDGVMVPMKDGEGSEKRAEAKADGKLTRGPSGYREAGCGSLSFYDEAGEILHAIRIGRMPETKKATLKSMLKEELGRALAEQPQLKVVAVADGAKDNWSYLNDEVLDALPSSIRAGGIIDFYHATEHLSDALGAAYGKGSVKARAMFDKHRRILLEDPDGATKVTRSLVHLRSKHPRRLLLQRTVTYFRGNKDRMRYADFRQSGLPIGSGPIEAACKTLVTQRMKNSGMRWGQEGGQAILTLRGWSQSDRFDQAWALLAATYQAEVRVISRVDTLEMAA